MGGGHARPLDLDYAKEGNSTALLELMRLVAGGTGTPARTSASAGHYKVYSSVFDGKGTDTVMP